MNELQKITDEMHALETKLQALNHKFNFNVDQMPANDYIDYENLQYTWDSLKRKRDAIKANQFTASLEVLEFGTDKVLSERVIGGFDTQSEAQQAAYKAQQEGETVCIQVPANYNAQEEEDLSCREMAERDADLEEWNRL